MTINPLKLQEKGYKALVDALGPVDTLKFIQQLTGGSGDYTRDRKKWLLVNSLFIKFRIIVTFTLLTYNKQSSILSGRGRKDKRY